VSGSKGKNVKIIIATTDTLKSKHWQNIRLLNPGPWAYSLMSDYLTSLPETFDKVPTWVRIPQGVSNPEMAVIEDEDGALILCKGMTGYSLVERYMSSCILSNNPATHTYGLGCFKMASDLIVGTGVFDRAPSQVRTTMVGHSYGGGVLASLVHNNPRGLLAGLDDGWTYGSPRSWTVGQSRMRPGRFVRTVLDNDPVPSLIPHVDQGPLNDWVFQLSIWKQFTDVIHPRGAIVLSSDGEYTYDQNPIVPLGRTALQFSEWMASDSAFGSNNHSIGAYANAAFAGLSWGGGAVEITVPQTQPRGQRPSNAEARQAYRDLVERQAIATSGSLVSSAQRVITGTTLVLGKRYYCETLSGRRCVSYNGFPVAWTTTRRKQVKLKNMLNKAIGM